MERFKRNTQAPKATVEITQSAEATPTSIRSKKVIGAIGARVLHSLDTATQPFAQDITNYYPNGLSRGEAPNSTNTNTLKLH